ncbi:MAG: TetR/AcrR family transcriptional regulator [Lachnospiraceae bacterium]|nr:TetR/AcrR family transcriptional regulator [Lachnospiraceae bacterium]
MKTEVLDRRVRKTRQQLRRCLATLLKEKKIQEITVREITEMADLNRGTFYLHYKDVFDLLEQVEHDLLMEFNSTLQKYQASDVQQKPSLIFSDVFHCVKKNADKGLGRAVSSAEVQAV